MTAQIDPSPQDFKAWAAEQLQVPLPSADDAVRAAYLRQAQNQNGGPNLTAREALLILTGQKNAATLSGDVQAAEDRLQRAVDEFSCQFFTLSPSERTARWKDLSGSAMHYARVEARLAALRPGLEVLVPPSERGSPESQLAQAVCDLFVQKPRLRAASRQAFVATKIREGTLTQWIKVAAQLRKTHAAFAALEPELIARLADAASRAATKKRLKRKLAVNAFLTGVKQSPWWSGNGLWIALTIAGMVGGLTYGILSSKAKLESQPPQPRMEQKILKDLQETLKTHELRWEHDGKKWHLKSYSKDGKQGEFGPAAVYLLFGEEAAKKLLPPKPEQGEQKAKQPLP